MKTKREIVVLPPDINLLRVNISFTITEVVIECKDKDVVIKLNRQQLSALVKKLTSP